MSEVWLKAKDVATKLGVSSSWVLRKARCKVGPDMAIIPHVRIGGVIRFSERQIEEWVKQHGIKGVLKV
jgi:predicted DNA-binding transcriptional regulator AlpA